MALVSGGRSTLNPNAPLFVPAAMRQVEDFSPEWWDLVTTSTWFSDYWLSQNQGEDVFRGEGGFDVNNASRLLPDSIDLDVDEDILNMESQYEEFLQSSEAGYGIKGGRVIENGFNKNINALVNMSKQRSPISPRGGMMYGDKPAQVVAPRYSPSFIQQPR